LVRIANAAIDIYTSVTVLSRATYALKRNPEAAKHDAQIAQLFCRSAAKRIQRNLADAANPDPNDLKQIQAIARQTFENGSLVHRHPIDL
jgi:hypothetical protein